MHDRIVIRGAREHNLKNLSLDIPRDKLVVITGLSGSGKSTLAFDTLHKEGQRQYLESMGFVTDRLTKAKADLIEGLSPPISVFQGLSNRSPRSTVGTSTEVYTYLRVLFARLGRRPCPSCGTVLPPPQYVELETPASEEENGAEETYPCPLCGAAVPMLTMAHFSFNKPAGACPTCTGLGEVSQPVMQKIIDPTRSIRHGGVLVWEKFHEDYYPRILQRAAAHYGFEFDPDQPIERFNEVQRELLLYGVESPRFRELTGGKPPPAHARDGRFDGVVSGLMRRYQEGGAQSTREYLERVLQKQTCPDCRGERLREASRKVQVAGRSILEIARLALSDLARWLEGLHRELPGEERSICDAVVGDLKNRVQRLLDVGAGYLSQDRVSPTLSAGEAQRLRLASLLGSGLTGVLYVLDEPTVGLHPRDTARLIQVLKRLRDLGNTVLVVEHDLEVMRAADYLVDIGPGAGRHGGELVAAGAPDEIARSERSITGAFLSGRATVARPTMPRPGNGLALVVRGARAHNLKDVTARFPLGTLIAVTGPSGSGKSSLVLDVLGRAAEKHFNGATEEPGEHDAVEGWEHLERVVTVDQTPIGRSPRSNAATYGDVFTPLRELFAGTPEARKAGLTARHFSFNVPGGRCERCEGAGVLSVQMHFMPEVEVPCPTCKGQRFKPEVFAVRCRGWNIADALNRTAEEALAVFNDVPKLTYRLKLLVDTGLGYLPLGQPATTLSGGEAQRVKLAKELGRREGGRTLYLLDEPTTGLHPADIVRLLAVLQRLVEAGNTVVVIEHNLDLVRAADWVIDLGPDGGDAGGRIVAQGTPKELMANPASITGPFLRD